jgi:hypothetical protein
MALVINTVRDHLEQGYRITLYCPHCRRHMDDYPLQRLIMRGRGDKPLSQIRLRHGCGTKLEIRDEEEEQHTRRTALDSQVRQTRP